MKPAMRRRWKNIYLNIPELLEVSHTQEGRCLVREKVEGKTLEQLMQEEPEKLETYKEKEKDFLMRWIDVAEYQ